MEHPYSIRNIVLSPGGRLKRADLYENDYQIAIVRAGDYRGDFKLRFLSERAETRFETFTESLSLSETIEAIWPSDQPKY